MSGKTGAYGTSNGGDTSFRKTWDRDEYAQRAKDNDRKHAEESKARYEAAAAGKKYHRRASTPPDARETEARTSRLDVASMVGKTQLVPAGASIGKRGKGAGFYCEDCDLTYKDNLEFVSHLNSRQHQIATGRTGEVRVASLEEVHERLRWIKRKRREAEKDEVIDLDARLENHREREEQEREEKRRKRNEKRRKTPGGLGHAEVKIENDGIIC
jgi:U4/U6.U5 tri-snRNP component SNU23